MRLDSPIVFGQGSVITTDITYCGRCRSCLVVMPCGHESARGWGQVSLVVTSRRGDGVKGVGSGQGASRDCLKQGEH